MDNTEKNKKIVIKNLKKYIIKNIMECKKTDTHYNEWTVIYKFPDNIIKKISFAIVNFDDGMNGGDVYFVIDKNGYVKYAVDNENMEIIKTDYEKNRLKI